MVRRAFRILVAVAVAVPLGQGGLCCCLFESAPGAEGSAAVASAEPSCCDTAPPVSPARSEPERSGEDRCGCPARDAAVLVSATPDAVGALSAPASLAAVVVAEPIARPSTVAVARGTAEAPAPVPKTPLFRAHCALLC